MWEKLMELFRRDLSTSPLETALFLFIIFGFFIFLVIVYQVRQRKERKRLAEIREEKWQRFCEKYKISDREKSFLEELADRLEMPDKKYLLLSDHKTFHHALKKYTVENRPDAELVNSIIKKAGMSTAKDIITDIPVQRRKSARNRVDISALISSAEEETAASIVRIYDLSRGGCRIENPEGRFSAGDDVKVSFTYKDKKYTDIPASVVRTSSGKKVLHLSFGHVRT